MTIWLHLPWHTEKREKTGPHGASTKTAMTRPNHRTGSHLSATNTAGGFGCPLKQPTRPRPKRSQWSGRDLPTRDAKADSLRADAATSLRGCTKTWLVSRC